MNPGPIQPSLRAGEDSASERAATDGTGAQNPGGSASALRKMTGFVRQPVSPRAYRRFTFAALLLLGIIAMIMVGEVLAGWVRGVFLERGKVHEE